MPPAAISSVEAAPKAAAAPQGQWLAGDLHVHDDHSSDGSALRQGLDGRGPGNVSVADQIGQGELNALAWMPLTDHRTYDQHYDPLWESDGLLLIPGEEANGSPHANVLGAVDGILQGAPYPGRPGWSVLQTSIWDAHSQDAVWSHNHPDDGHVNDDGSPNERANAVGADTVEVWNKASGIETELRYAENRWNAGYRFGSVGASDNHFRELWTIAGPGLPASFAFAAAASERAILDGLAAGRTVVAARNDGVAPLLTLEADADGDGVYEALAGDECVIAAGRSVKLRVRIQRGTGTTVSLYRNPGRGSAQGLFARYQPLMPDDSRVFDFPVTAEAGWVYVEARGPGEIDAVDTGSLGTGFDPMAALNAVADARRAITSPVFVGPALAEPRGAMPLPADRGIDDGAIVAIGEAQQFAGFPDLAVSEGLGHLVAERHAPGRTRVVYRRMAVDGTLSAEIDLAPTSDSARFPRVAARGQAVWVAWQDERDGQQPRRPAIYLRESRDGGLSWQPEQKLRSLAGRAERPALALTPQGAPVIAWQEIRAGEPFDVFVQVPGRDAAPVNVSRTGKRFNAASAADTRSALWPASVWPALAVRADGRIALAYQDNRDDQDPLWTGQTGTGDGTEVDDWQIRVHVRASDAADWSAPAVLGAADRADRHPTLAFAGDGALVAAWDSKDLAAAGSNRSIRFARSPDGGASFAAATAPEAIALDAGADSQHPRLGTDADGRPHVVWWDNRAADWRWRTMSSVLGSDGHWAPATMLMGKGLGTWPVTAGGVIAYASTRHAQRLQRDRTQQIAVVRTDAPAPAMPPASPPPPAIGSAPVADTAAASGRYGGSGSAILLLALLSSALLRRFCASLRRSAKVQIRFRSQP